MNDQDLLTLDPSPWRRALVLLPGEVLYLLGLPVAVAFAAAVLLVGACRRFSGDLWVFLRTQVGAHYRGIWRTLKGVRRSTYGQ